jgi:hypothetical protein
VEKIYMTFLVEKGVPRDLSGTSFEERAKKSDSEASKTKKRTKLKCEATGI